MMTDEERIKKSETYVKENKYDKALEILEPMECVMGCWLKGQIYMNMANKFANSFQYKYYKSDAQTQHYREILTYAEVHLDNAASLMPSAAYEIQVELNQVLWYELGKARNELARTKPIEDLYNDYDFDGDYQVDMKQEVDSIINDIEFWRLSKQ